MATADLKTVYTPQDMLKMPDGDRYELVDGQLVEKSMSFWSCRLSDLFQPPATHA